MTLKGIGLLTYECRAKADDAAIRMGVRRPRRGLADAKRAPMGKYYGGPTWEPSDGSKVTGKQLAVRPARAGDIPLQLVQAPRRATARSRA